MRPSRAVSVAVFLGTGRGWQQALGKFFGSKPLSELLQPSIRLASRGFTVDSTYRQQTLDNLARFRGFTSMRETFLKNGQTPAVGSTFRNPDLAATYGRIANEGDAALYSGQTARAIVDAVRRPPVVPGTTRNVRPGLMRTKDLADYRSVERAPTVSSYRGLQVYGMGPLPRAVRQLARRSILWKATRGQSSPRRRAPLLSRGLAILVRRQGCLPRRSRLRLRAARGLAL
jgi:gamma-glutamyltranspeptidase